MKFDWFDSEKYLFTDESVKRQITDSISENLIDSDLESVFVQFNVKFKYSLWLDKSHSIKKNIILQFKIRNLFMPN